MNRYLLGPLNNSARNGRDSLVRKTRFAAVIAALSIAASIAAAPAPAQDDLGPIIDGLQRKYSRMRGLSADFTQLYNGSDGRAARESGQLLLKRPGKARWEYSSPSRKLFISDGQNIYFYVDGDRHATRASVKASADPQIPFLFLLGRGDLRRDFSKIELLSNERAVGPGNRVLRLVPKRAPEEFRKLLVEVNPSTFEVKRMVIFERSGSRMDFILSNIKENFIAPDAQFQFTPPAGVSVRQQ